jgi:hypothetical protein
LGNLTYLEEKHKQVFKFLDLEMTLLGCLAGAQPKVTSYSEDMRKRSSAQDMVNLYLILCEFDGLHFTKIGLSAGDPMKRDTKAYKKLISQVKVPVEHASLYEGYAIFSGKVNWPGTSEEHKKLAGWSGSTEAIHTTNSELEGVFHESINKIKHFLLAGGDQTSYICDGHILWLLTYAVSNCFDNEANGLRARTPYLIRDHQEEINSRGLSSDPEKLAKTLQGLVRPMRKAINLSALDARIRWRKKMGYAWEKSNLALRLL